MTGSPCYKLLMPTNASFPHAPAGCKDIFNLLSIVSPYLQYLGTSQGVFFDLNTMEPLINNQAMAEAARILAALRPYGAPDEESACFGEQEGGVPGGLEVQLDLFTT